MLQYDGSHWTTYPVPNRSCVRSLLYFNNTIYAGAENDFGYYEPSKTGHLFFHSLKDLLPDPHLSFGNIWKIHEMDNVLYFQAEKCIFKYIGNTISIIDIDEKIEYSNIVHNILWVVTSKNTYYLVGDVLMSLEYPQLKDKRIVSILPYKGKKQLLITALDGIFVFDGKAVEPLPTEVDGLLKTSRVFCAAQNDDYIALGTVQNGLIVLNYKGELFTLLNVSSGLCNNTILSLNFDANNNLWLGLDDGISFIALNYPITNLYGSSNFYGKGMASFLKDGYLYLGTNQSLMLKKWPIKTEQTPITLERIQGISGQVWSLNEIQGDLFCAHDNGIFLIKGNNAHYIHGTNGSWLCKSDINNPDKIITGTYDGFQVLRKENNQWKYVYDIKGFSGPVTNFEIEGNIIWKADNQKGIARLELNESGNMIKSIVYYATEKGLPSINNNAVYRINDRIVFSTTKGIYKYNPVKDMMEEDPEMNAILPGKRPYTSLHKYGNDEKYWYIFDWSSIGYSKLNKITGKYEMDTHTGQYFHRLLFDGFEHINPINDSCTLVGTEDGFSWINPMRTNDNLLKPPHLSIRKVWLRAENDSLIYGNSYKEVPFDPVIPYDKNSLRIEFGAMDFGFNSDLQYSYKLENYDDKWSEYSKLNIKEYTKLREGDYKFLVKAKSNYIDEPVYTQFSFKILPPWYRTHTAYIVYLVLLFIFLGIMVWIFNIILEKNREKISRKKDLEMQKQENRFRHQAMEQEKEILSLKQEQLEHELKLKSNELATTIMMVRNKNEMFSDVNNELNKIHDNLKSLEIKKEIRRLQQKINQSKE